MIGGAWPIGSPTAAVARFGGRWRWMAALFGTAGVALAGVLAQANDADSSAARAVGAVGVAGAAGSAPAAPSRAPALADTAAVGMPVVAAAAVPGRADAAVVQPGMAPTGGVTIRPLADGRLDVDLLGADRRPAIAALAEATGTRLHGFDALPRPLGRVTLRMAGVDRGTAWQRLLEGAAVGFALTCDRRSCAVWFAPAAGGGATVTTTVATPSTAGTAVGSGPNQRAESTESEN